MDKQALVDDLQVQLEDLMVIALPQARMKKRIDEQILNSMVSILKELEANLSDEVFLRKSLCFCFFTILTSLYAEENHAKHKEELSYIIGTLEEQIHRVLS